MEVYNPNIICKLLIARLIKNEISSFLIIDSIHITYTFENNGNGINFYINTEDELIESTTETIKGIYKKIDEIKNIIKIESVYKIDENVLYYDEYDNGTTFYGCNQEQIKIKHQLLLIINFNEIKIEKLNEIYSKIDKLLIKFQNVNDGINFYLNKKKKKKEKKQALFNEVMVNLLKGNSFGANISINVQELINNPLNHTCNWEYNLNQELRKIIKNDLPKQILQLEKEITKIADNMGIKNILPLLKKERYHKIQMVLNKFDTKNIKFKQKIYNKQLNEIDEENSTLFNALKKTKLINKESKDIASNLPVINKNFSFGLNSIDADISYLRCSSFGATPVLAVDSRTVIEACNLKLHMYYYPAHLGSNKAGIEMLMKTPWGKNEMYSNKYEGKNHPYCKIELPTGYNNFTFNDRGIFDGSKIIYEISQTPENIDDNMLLALIINSYYSLYERLSNYIFLLESDKIIDQGHINAGFFTRNNMEKLFESMKEYNKKLCIKNWLNQIKFNMKFIIHLFNQMEFYRLNREPIIKNYIITFYNNLFNNEPLPSLPELPELKILLPKKLNLN